MQWLLAPVLPKRQWPEPSYKAKRATEFRRCCRRAGVKGVTLHCYRYSWAEREKQAGYPERYAMAALGHNSKAVHRAYSRNAQVTVPSLDEYEKAQSQKKIVAASFKVA